MKLEIASAGIAPQRWESGLSMLLGSVCLPILAALVAALARKLVLGALETRIAWAAFYPVVISNRSPPNA